MSLEIVHMFFENHLKDNISKTRTNSSIHSMAILEEKDEALRSLDYLDEFDITKEEMSCVSEKTEGFDSCCFSDSSLEIKVVKFF